MTPATATEFSSKNSLIDYQRLGPISGPEDVAKNTHQFNMSDIPNAILQMAYHNLYIPLSMLTTSAPSKIHTSDGLKFHKIPFVNGISKQSLDKSVKVLHPITLM